MRHYRVGLAPAPYLRLALAVLDKAEEALSELIIVGALFVLQAIVAVTHLHITAAEPQQQSRDDEGEESPHLFQPTQG